MLSTLDAARRDKSPTENCCRSLVVLAAHSRGEKKSSSWTLPPLLFNILYTFTSEDTIHFYFAQMGGES